jgi:beta-glucosidase
MQELIDLRFPTDASPGEKRVDESHAIRVTTVWEGIQQAVSGGTDLLYARGCEVMDEDRTGFAEADRIARQADAVILVLGDRSGLTPSCSTGETRDSCNLRLPGVQQDLAEAVIATGKPVVVVLITGRPYAFPWLAEHASAILQAWLPGEEGGGAIADALFGEINPGGKLPITFPRGVGQLPITYSVTPSGLGSFWYTDYVDEKVTPLYPFGYGLSYTAFAYADLEISPQVAMPGEKVDISLTVQNTGRLAGDEVVQLYVRDEIGCVPRPIKELKGYVRLSLLPGESKAITFHLPVDQLAFYDSSLNLVLEPGKSRVMLGSSSQDIRLSGEFTISGTRKMPVTQRVFYCPVEVD